MSYRTDADWRASGNTNGNMGSKLGICVHHSAGMTIDMAGTFLANGTSAHYAIEPGHVRQFLEDRDNAWAAGHQWANNRLIHVECVNSAVGGGWPVAEATVDTLVEFLADKCREYGWLRLDVGENLFGHRDFYATECPGVLYGRLGEIARRVNERIDDEGDEDMAFTDEDKKKLDYIYNELSRTDDAGWGNAQGHTLFGRVNMILHQLTRIDAEGHLDNKGHDFLGTLGLLTTAIKQIAAKVDQLTK